MPVSPASAQAKVAGAGRRLWRRDAPLTSAQEVLEGLPEELRTVLANHRVHAAVETDDEDRQVIAAYIADFARQFADRASLKASTTRAYNLYRRAGLSREQFVAKLHEAGSVTKDRSRPIPSGARESAPGIQVTAKMAFYFAVLEDLLGLRPAPGNTSDL